MLNILFIVDETFTGKIKHIKENDEDSQVFEQNQMNNQTLQICPI